MEIIQVKYNKLMCRNEVRELHVWINKLRWKNILLPESRACKNMLYP